MSGKIHLGTCSWKYPSWEGLVYSSKKPENFLQEYALKYASVEVDQWFWSLFGLNTIVLPKEATVREYCDAVPEDFRFVVKAPNSISLTHLYKQYTRGELIPNEHFLNPELFEQFVYSIRDLRPKLGAISLQFEYLNKTKMPSAQMFLTKFLDFLQKIDTTIPLCIEVRNPQFLTRTYFQTLADHGVGHTFCQGYYMPDIRAVYETAEGLLQGTQIIRLLGPDRKGIEAVAGDRWDRVLEPKDEEIPGIAALIRKMVDQANIDLYLNVNNHYEGSAPRTIEKMLTYLEAEADAHNT